MNVTKQNFLDKLILFDNKFKVTWRQSSQVIMHLYQYITWTRGNISEVEPCKNNRSNKINC